MRSRPSWTGRYASVQSTLGGWCDARVVSVARSSEDADRDGLSRRDPHIGEATLRATRRPIVIETKLAPTVASSGQIPRPALVERIVQASAAVTLINAPAGYGKTTLLSQCRAALGPSAAWVSLDESDDDPIVLLAEIATAIDRIVPLDPAYSAVYWVRRALSVPKYCRDC